MKNKTTLVPLALTFIFLFCAKAVPQFNGQRAFKDLEKQVSFGPRVPGSDAAGKCLNWLEGELNKTAEKVVKQPFSHYDKRNKKTIYMNNLIASFNTGAGQRVFLAAHWDSRPFSDQDSGENAKKAVPGANDGASGVAVLLEIARNLKRQTPEIGVDLIFFDGEDFGPEGKLDEYFLGSRYFARNAGNYRPRYGILLDMVGDAQLNIPIEGYSMEYLPHVVEKVWSTAESLGMYQFERRMGGYINDDHKMLIEEGIPCIDIIDFAYPDESNRYWHTRQDTPDKCSAESLEAVGTVLLNVIYNEELN